MIGTHVFRGGVAGLGLIAFFASPAFAQTANSGSLSGAISGSIAGSNSATNVKTTAVSKNTNTNVTASKSNASSGSIATSASTQGNNNGTQNLQLNSYTPDKQTIYNVPNVYAPGLAAAGTEVCLGSVSAGGAGAGFGLSIGGTFVDKECQLRLNARTLATLG